VTLTFAFWPSPCFIYSASHAPPTHRFWLSYDYRLLSYELLNFIPFPLFWTVNAHAQYHVTCIAGSPKPDVTIFDPMLSIHYTNFMTLWRRLRGVYIVASNAKDFSVAKKLSSQNWSPNGGFSKYKGQNIKYSHRDPKRDLLTRNDVFWRILRKNPLKGVSRNLIEEPPKTNKKLVTPKARQNHVHVFGEQKPLNRSLQNFVCRVPARS